MTNKTMLRTLLVVGVVFVATGVAMLLLASSDNTSSGMTLIVGGVLSILATLFLVKTGD